ncbi:DUF3221 domain-containing protein [Halalkalibacter alkalisediminis]|uniref:DUF3221 domain-containing protein n=1 Tax=Halalkalibacter alkalisediminis TaxID=935616 RepID=A0ABV6NHB6_9BACI|nr:DUF3221 domain-containing protein [Halalkalibacter alkalisediminis]
MKKFIVLFFFLLIVGCAGTAPLSAPGITGFVTDIQGNRILVVSSDSKDFSSTGGIAEFYNAIWFTNAPVEIKVGDKVKVWYDFVADSYPGQSEVIYVTKVYQSQPKETNLTEPEVLSSALSSLENKSVMAVKSIKFNESSLAWKVTLYDTFSNMEIHIDVVDEK